MLVKGATDYLVTAGRRSIPGTTNAVGCTSSTLLLTILELPDIDYVTFMKCDSEWDISTGGVVLKPRI